MRFIYEKYTSQPYFNLTDEVYVGTYVSTSPLSGYQFYYFDHYSGAIILESPITINPGGVGSVYTSSGDTLIRREWFDNDEYGRYERTIYFSRYVRGNFIGTVIAEDGTYPDDGRHTDGYWYVKKKLADKPTLLQPIGGETVTGPYEIKWTPAVSGMTYRIELSTDNGATWKLLRITNVDATSYTHDFYQEAQSSVARIRIRGEANGYYTDWVQSSGVFAILHNVPPSAPTLISPLGIPIDRTQVQRFSWRFNDQNVNDMQSKALLEWKPKDSTTWNSVTINSSNTYYDMSANVFPQGEIVWRVKTYDQFGLESPYSIEGIFTASDPAQVPTITAPSDIVSIARPTIQWWASEQIAYQIVITDALGVILWDTGEVASQAKARTVGVDLENGGIYVVKLRVKNNIGLWSDYALKTITVSYTPPAIPSVEIAEGNGVIVLSITNPAPNETQPNIIYNEIYRREKGKDTWTRIATNVPENAYFTDYTPASGQVYEYFVRAWGDNGTYSDSAVVSESISLTGVWLHEADNPLETLHQFKLVSERSENWQPTAAMMQFAGRRLPVAEYDDTEQRTISMKITVLKNSDDREAIERLIRSKNTLCYRDARGRKMFCHAFQLSVDDETYGNTVSLTFEEVSYTEGV